MTQQWIPYAKQHINSEDICSVTEALKEDLITRGPVVDAFEKAICEYVDVPYAVAFNSGTAALMGAYFAAELTPYDRLLTTPNSFIASIGVPCQRNLPIEFIDIDRSCGNLKLENLEKKLQTPMSRGKPVIVPVHFSGIALDMELFSSLINHPDAIVIEDAAHAIGSTYPSGQKVGCCLHSDMTIFSFHPAKTMTTGEGGMVTTYREDLYHRLRLFRDNGIERTAPYLKGTEELGYYEVQAITGNYHLTSFQAALGISQLKKINTFVSKRQHLVKIYRERLKNHPLICCFDDQYDEKSAYHLFVIQIDFKKTKRTRSQVMNELKNSGIGTQVHYIPLYRHPVLSHYTEAGIASCPEMEHYYQQALSLPLYYDLTEEKIHFICDTLELVLRG